MSALPGILAVTVFILTALMCATVGLPAIPSLLLSLTAATTAFLTGLMPADRRKSE